MKIRIISLITALCSVAALLAGCAGNGQPPRNGSEETSAPETTEATTEETTTQIVVRPNLRYKRITLSKRGESFPLYIGSLEGIEWKSLEPEIADVESGLVTAVAEGKTEIQAKYKGEVFSCTVVCDFSISEDGNYYSVDGINPRAPVLPPPTKEVVDSSFFDDAVFVGDSISVMLRFYAERTGCFGNATFLARESYGVANEVVGGYHIIFRGEQVPLDYALKETGAKKVFLMLGTNDIGAYGVDGTMEYWEELLEMIRAELPDIDIYIQSMTPVWTGGESGSLNNVNVNAYNKRLRAFAEENGCSFIEISSYMKDSTGGLATEYTSDRYVHMTNKGVEVWVSVLKAYTDYKK